MSKISNQKLITKLITEKLKITNQVSIISEKSLARRLDYFKTIRNTINVHFAGQGQVIPSVGRKAKRLMVPELL